MQLLKNFWKDEEGQDLMQYALLLGFITLSLVSIISGIAGNLQTMYGRTSDAVASAAGSGS
ncbi:MAG: Flp family type IVb pilin [Bryobacteraceae bacterium]